MELHTPDLALQNQGKAVSADTPTRRSGDNSDLAYSIGGFSLNSRQNTAASGSTGAFETKITGLTGLPYIPLNNNFAFTTNTLPVFVGGSYSTQAVDPLQQYYTTTSSQHNPSGNGFNTLPAPAFGTQGFERGVFGQRDFNHAAFQQPDYGFPFGYMDSSSTSQSRSVIPHSRAVGRRQNAMRMPQNAMMRGRQHQNSNSHHNHVDINRIRQGIDVRTTVSSNPKAS